MSYSRARGVAAIDGHAQHRDEQLAFSVAKLWPLPIVQHSQLVAFACKGRHCDNAWQKLSKPDV